MRIVICLFLLVLISEVHAAQIKKLTSPAGEVVWIEDDRLPTFTAAVYFADGALSDNPARAGETSLMFDLLSSGTNRYNQKEIAEHLEYYGASYGATVTHEYSNFVVSGLVKDAMPIMKMICHTFRGGIFPKRELKKHVRIGIDRLKNLATSPSALADRAFRQITMRGTNYANHTSGTMRTIKRIRQKHMVAKLDYFNNKVAKKIYLTGPKEILKIKNIFAHDCGWSAKKETFARTIPKNIKKGLSANKAKIDLIVVPKSNQAQIRIGRFLTKDEIQGKSEIMTFASSFLGGGFTSVLMRELRLKHGLTYGVYSFLAGQKYYGRAGVVTSIRNEKVPFGIEVIRDALDSVGNAEFSDENLNKIKGYLAGDYLFGFEKKSSFMSKVIFYHHTLRHEEEIYQFPEIIKLFTKQDLADAVKDYFSWDQLKIVIVGDKSLKKQLKKLGKVRVTSYKKYF